MTTEYPEDVDVALWQALDKAFWAYAAVRMQGSGSVIDKLAQVTKDYLDYIKDLECYYDE